MVKFEKGKWYKCSNLRNKAGRLHHIDGNMFYCDMWICNEKYESSLKNPTWLGIHNFSTECLNEIQKYLPKNHPDLLKLNPLNNLELW